MSGHWKHLLRWAISLLRLWSCIAETLIFPAASEMVRTMCREEKAQELKMILCENTVKRRIDAIAENMRTEKHHSSPGYALQMDVSALGRNCFFVCYMQEDAFVRIFCLPLPGRETAQAKYGDLHNFMEEKQNSLGGMVGFCVDGAPATAGRGMVCGHVSPSGAHLQSGITAWIIANNWPPQNWVENRAHHRRTAAGRNHGEPHRATPSACRESTFSKIGLLIYVYIRHLWKAKEI